MEGGQRYRLICDGKSTDDVCERQFVRRLRERLSCSEVKAVGFTSESGDRRDWFVVDAEEVATVLRLFVNGEVSEQYNDITMSILGSEIREDMLICAAVTPVDFDLTGVVRSHMDATRESLPF